MEVETDKAVFPVEANARGVIHIGPYKQGDVLPVLAVVAIIGKPDDRFEAGGIVSGAPASETVPADSAIPAAGPSALPAAKAENEKPFASPRARKLAGEKNVDLAAVSPTGYGGLRVAERDVLSFLAQAPRVTPVAQAHGRAGWR